jgi:hypothetical protein
MLKILNTLPCELSKFEHIKFSLARRPNTTVNDSRRTKASFQTPTPASPSPAIDWAHQRAQKENSQALMLVPDQLLQPRLAASSTIFAGKRHCFC